MNLLSIFLGILGLSAAVMALRSGKNRKLTAVSFGTCGAALLCQLAEIYRLTQIGDTSAIYDTVHARFLAGCCLLGLTLGLHLIGNITKP